jgi:hypothetical protein
MIEDLQDKISRILKTLEPGNKKVARIWKPDDLASFTEFKNAIHNNN